MMSVLYNVLRLSLWLSIKSLFINFPHVLVKKYVFCKFLGFLKIIYLFIYFWLCWVFVSVRGLFSSCGKRGPLFITVRGPLTLEASLVAEHRLQTRRLSSCGSQAQLLRGMWDLPRPGLEPMSPALAGRLSTTAPPGKPSVIFLGRIMYMSTKSTLLIKLFRLVKCL